MSITLPKEIENRLIGSVKKYFEENLDSEIGDLKATLLLDFFLKEIGPTIYCRRYSMPRRSSPKR
jgi:uncharacterized protein (DUF2164 family)